MLHIKKYACTALIIYTLITAACHYYNHDLSVTNLSKHNITILHSNTSLPHTENNVEFYIADSNIIPPDSTYIPVIPGRSDAWRLFIEDGAEKKLFIYVFSVDTLNKYRGPYMNELIRAHKYLAVQQYSVKELDCLKWKITFNDVR